MSARRGADIRESQRCGVKLITRKAPSLSGPMVAGDNSALDIFTSRTCPGLSCSSGLLPCRNYTLRTGLRARIAIGVLVVVTVGHVSAFGLGRAGWFTSDH